MRSRIVPLMSLAGIAALLIPHAVFAAIPVLDSTFHILPQTATNCALGWNGVLETIQNVMNAAVEFGIMIAVLTIGYAGILWILSPLSAENRQKGRTAIITAFAGLALVLTAWLIVSTLMSIFYNAGPFGGQSWDAIIQATGSDPCLPLIPNNAPLQGTSPLSGTPGGSGVGGNGIYGRCVTPTVGPCSEASLSQTCFGSNAALAGEFCNQESGGVPSIPSGADVLADGHAYSAGLFQTNLTNSFDSITVDGQKCSTAFSGACQGSHVQQHGSGIGHCDQTVTNPRLYQDCLTASKDAATGIQAACNLSNNGTSWNHWNAYAPDGSLVPECLQNTTQ